MVLEYKGKKFMTDGDLNVEVLGYYPGRGIQNPELRKAFLESLGRDFLGGDEIVSYAQSLVSKKLSFPLLEEEILKDANDPEKGGIRNITFKKTATGIGRGHSLGGLAGIVLGLNGTKMIDSGLSGFVVSRSLATSSRRRETTSEEIVVPEVLFSRPDLLDKYLEISRDVFKVAEEFKSRFGKSGGVETFNKVIPYNNPGDLFIVMPLDTMAALTFEVEQDNTNTNGRFVPRELHKLAEMFPEIAEKTGMGTMFSQRVRVPRDSYLHYTVFKDPSLPNYALENAEARGMPLEPIVIDSHKDLTPGFRKGLDELIKLYELTKAINKPDRLADSSMMGMLELRQFVNDYNEAVRVKVLDSLSWRVWSEQKRHATLRQNVESVYSAADRAYQIVRRLWPQIKTVSEGGEGEIPYEELEKAIIIDERLKKNPELGVPYAYHTAKQLMFYGKLLENGISERDALYAVPKNIRVRTLENYDLINLIDLELPLRLCETCEPERKATSWKKRDEILKVVPEIGYFLKPKCNVGFCTEGNFCGNITDLREYNGELHKATKQAMLGR